MVINGTVVNNTTCNFTDCRPSGDAKIQKISPNLYMNPDEGGYGVLVNQAVAPLVANGMMMVLVEPETQSGTFSLADSALTKAEAEIRLGPGTNYAVIGAVPENATCSFLNPLNQLNGILAKGSYWWKVEFDGLVGWLQEELLHANGIFRIYFPIIFR